MSGRGLLLFSGGLDSLIAARILTEQDITLTGIHFILPFKIPGHSTETETVSSRAREAGIDLLLEYCTTDYLNMLRNPKHGYGKNMNPCIDCKIFFLKRAAEIMREMNADFIATGEVSGQRPMSQRRDMIIHIEHEAQLEGKILRPLCAHDFAETDAEKNGIVDRSKLLSIYGRGRTIQLDLAKKYGISDYSSPSGGCAFTDPNFARRLKELFDHSDDPKQHEIFLLSIGRHYRLKFCKQILSRDAGETELLYKFSDLADFFIEPCTRGPVSFLIGEASAEDITLAIDNLASYCKAQAGDEFSATVTSRGGMYEQKITASGSRILPI